MEYRSAGGVGPLTMSRSMAIDGGLGFFVGDFSASADLTFTVFGFVASLAFSCSSRARSNAVYSSGAHLVY